MSIKIEKYQGFQIEYSDSSFNPFFFCEFRKEDFQATLKADKLTDLREKIDSRLVEKSIKQPSQEAIKLAWGTEVQYSNPDYLGKAIQVTLGAFGNKGGYSSGLYVWVTDKLKGKRKQERVERDYNNNYVFLKDNSKNQLLVKKFIELGNNLQKEREKVEKQQAQLLGKMEKATYLIDGEELPEWN